MADTTKKGTEVINLAHTLGAITMDAGNVCDNADEFTKEELVALMAAIYRSLSEAMIPRWQVFWMAVYMERRLRQLEEADGENAWETLPFEAHARAASAGLTDGILAYTDGELVLAFDGFLKAANAILAVITDLGDQHYDESEA